jgi:hypothetical protein
MVSDKGRVWRWLLVLLLAVAGSGPLAAQQPELLAVSDSLVEVRLADGETYVGRIVAVQGDTLTLQGISGVRVQFTRAQVVAVRAAQGRVEGGAFWREDPNRTRLFFSPTGRSLAAGDGYFGVYELFIPFVAYGITDRIIIAGGSPFYLAFLGDVTPPLYLGPKVQVVDRPNLQGSVGALTVLVPDGDDGGEFGSDDDDIFGIAYGVGTFGGPDRAVTAGIGWGYVGSDLSSEPVVMLGGETRVSRSIKLLTENVLVPGGDSGLLYSAGIRFFGERLSADAGLVGFVGDGDSGCCFPLVNFVYNFGGR